MHMMLWLAVGIVVGRWLPGVVTWLCMLPERADLKIDQLIRDMEMHPDRLPDKHTTW